MACLAPISALEEVGNEATQEQKRRPTIGAPWPKKAQRVTASLVDSADLHR